MFLKCFFCSDIRASPKIALFPPNDNKICFKRMKGVNFNSVYQNMNNAGECNNGFKKCGFVRGETEGVCIANDKDCPVTDVVLSASAPSQNAESYTKLVIQSNPELNLYFTKESVAAPLLSGVISENVICLNPEQLGSSLRRSGYGAYLTEKPITCVEDPLPKKWEGQSWTEQSLLDFNQVSYADLPSFKVKDEYLHYRFTKHLSPWRPICHSMIPEIETGFTTQLDSVQSNINIFYVLLLLLAFFLIPCFIVEFFGIFDFDFSWRKSERVKILTMTCRFVYTMVVGLVGLFLSISSKNKTNEANGFILQECTATLLNEAFKENSGTLEEDGVLMMRRAALFLTFFYLLEFLFNLYFHLFLHRQTKAEVEAQEAEMKKKEEEKFRKPVKVVSNFDDNGQTGRTGGNGLGVIQGLEGRKQKAKPSFEDKQKKMEDLQRSELGLEEIKDSDLVA
jgi:hypothetical protein